MFEASGRRSRISPAAAGYSPGFFPPWSSSETPASSEDALVLSLRPLACDLRRLRFSRNASFSRSFLGSMFGFLPADRVCVSRLSFSSFMMDLFECRRSNSTAGTIDRWAKTMHWRLRRNGHWMAGTALSPQATKDCWPRCCQNILCSARRSCNRRYRGGLRLCRC